MKNVLVDLLKFKRQNPGVENDEILVEAFMDSSDLVDVPMWNKEDIRIKAKDNGIELTEPQVNEVADLITYKHDANEGINWTVIDCYIDMVLRDAKNKENV
jgi:hypothetical protein